MILYNKQQIATIFVLIQCVVIFMACDNLKEKLTKKVNCENYCFTSLKMLPRPAVETRLIEPDDGRR